MSNRHNFVVTSLCTMALLAGATALTAQQYSPNRPPMSDSGVVRARGNALAQPMFERGGVAAQSSYSRRTRIVYQDSCGWQGAGRSVYVQSSPRNRSVVTVRESCNCGRERWSRTRTYYLEPGAEQRIGCTRGDTGVEWMTYTIVGERVR